MFVTLEVILFATAASAVVRGAPEYANSTYDYVSVIEHSVDDFPYCINIRY